jgi:ATP-dependent DNA helicase RecG
MATSPISMTIRLDEPLHQLVQRLARPIAFASRDGGAHVSTVKNLGPFVSHQVVQALADQVYLPHIETELLALRELFADFDRQSDVEQPRRLAMAKTILDRLSATGTPQVVQGHGRQKPPSRVIVPSRAAAVWNMPVQFVRGVGPKRALLLERLGVLTVEDALWCLPWRYEDRSVVTPIARLSPGIDSTICGTILTSSVMRTARRGMTLVQVRINDDTGTLSVVYFNQPYLERILTPGTRIMMSGRVTAGRAGWTDLQMESPQYEVIGEEDDAVLHVGRIVPIYHETKGLTSRQIRTMIKGLLDEFLSTIEELVPAAMQRKYGLPSIQTALAEVHFPPTGTDVAALHRGTTPAHKRLAFEECLLLELALAMRQRSVKEDIGIQFQIDTPLIGQLRKRLPFQLTLAQQRVFSEIRSDMGVGRPMNRLVQGDVGCGKTIVALHAMLLACGSGYQAALMAPTEILAEQHYLNLREMIHDLGLTSVLLKSGGSAKAKTAVMRQIQTGEAQIVVGTHALIQKKVQFKQLGLVVVDEQHKFGVVQRKTLVEKAAHPDVLVLTATPIPRTLAMTVYGDLDVSVIDSLPPGRRPIQTWLFTASQRRRAYQVVHDELAAGHQGYIVYPLVEESEKIDLAAAIQAAEGLQLSEFAQYRVGLLHGRMKTDEKARTMAAFKAGEIQVLVATTVVEVGVDVPNASVMLIEHADRFGMAQLHQLRGRVGRGTQASYCLFVTTGESGTGMKDRGMRSQGARDNVMKEALWGTASSAITSSQSRERLEVLVRTTDGFEIAEEDLRIRGPGEFFGVRQWGIPEFRAAQLLRDRVLLEQARDEAFALIRRDPHLIAPPSQSLRAAMLRRWQDKLDLGAIS